MTPDAINATAHLNAVVRAVATKHQAIPWVNARGTGPAPLDSPMKVWTGTEWAPAGINVEE